MTKPGTWFLVLVVMACFAANSVATRFVVNGGWLDPAGVTIARFAAGAGMLAVLLASRGHARAALPRLSDWPLVSFLGGYALAIAYGYRYITAAAGTFVFYALVIATMTAGGPRPSWRAAAGALIALAGVAVLAVGRVAGTTPLGVVLLALTGATWGAYSLLLRRRGRPLETNACAFVGVTFLLPVLGWIERDALVFTASGLAMGLSMGAITTALAYALWAKVLPTLTPIEAGTVQLIVPVLTAIVGVALLGEPFSFRLAVAGSLVLTGMWLTTRAKPAPAPSAPGASPVRSRVK